MTGAGAVTVGARPATIEDIDSVSDLTAAAREAVADTRGGPVLLSTDQRSEGGSRHLETALTDDSRRLLAGTLDEVIVGYLLAALVKTPGGLLIAEVEEIYVEDGARRVGVGAAMFDRLVSWAVDHDCGGIDALALPGDRDTKNFFESHGLVARAIIAHRPLGDESEPQRER